MRDAIKIAVAMALAAGLALTLTACGGGDWTDGELRTAHIPAPPCQSASFVGPVRPGQCG